MKVALLISEYVLHNHIIESCAKARPEDELMIVKVPLALRGKGRLGSAQSIFPKLSRRFLSAKLLEHFGLLVLTFSPKIFCKGAVFRRLRVIARRVGACYFETSDVNSETTCEHLQKFQPDVIITLMHQIVRERLCSIPKYGVVNIHPGLLPEVRGIQPYFWALSEGMGASGVTMHFIRDETIDTGEIVASARFDTKEIRSVQLCYYLTALLAAKLLPLLLEGFEKGNLCALAQSVAEGKYYRWPDSKAFNALWANGCSLFSLRDLWSILRGDYDGFEAQDYTIHRS